MQTLLTSTNPELDLAFDYVVNTDRSVFLTGKAGTGKTTFLKRLREHTPKRITIVAPTVIAAITLRFNCVNEFRGLKRTNN